ncbi:MAG: GPI anchored serine-threonine rich family protein [Candidatus Staskawiczbacteria bacterium]|nr:GPI anchored serine-threonine rich family protein [Candidatus Staskawiczbacteria bacterium]
MENLPSVLPQKVTPTINPVSVAGNCDSLSKCWDGSAFIAGQGCVKGFARGGGYGVTCTRYDTANDDDSVGVNGVAFCGNGWCDGSETISSCPTDCKVSNYKVCGVWQDCIDKSAIFMKDTKDCSLLDDAQNSLISPAKYKTQTVCCGDKNIFGNCSKRELLKDAYATPIETSIGTVNIKANNSDGSVAVASGSSVTLNWESKNALYDTCTASGDWVGEKSNSGSETIQNITSSKTFSIDCHNSNDTVLVNVNSSTSSTIQDLTAKLNSLQQQLNALNESASIKIKYPNGGEALAVGKTYSITWNSFKVGNVNIDLLSGQTGTLATVVRIATNISASTGSFAWKVPTTVTKGNKFKIRIKGVNTTSSSVGFQDDSDGYFSIIQ